jgi:hypothetical protein
MIRSGYYRSNKFQDSNKRKRTENKTMGYLRNKFLKSYFTWKLPEIRRGVGEGPPGPHTHGWRGPDPGRAAMV